jgi:phospholipase/lecithinase/hemolysin
MTTEIDLYNPTMNAVNANGGLAADQALPVTNYQRMMFDIVHPLQRGHDMIASIVIAALQQIALSSKIPLTRTGGEPLTRVKGISTTR